MTEQQRSPTVALAVATLGFAVAFAAWSLLSPLISGIQRELALTEFQTSMVIAVPVILGSLLRLPLGILTDRYGGRRVFTGLLLLVVPALVILSQARSFPMLLLGGLWLGLGGASFAVGVPFVSRHYPPARQGFVLGVYGAGNIGTALAARAAPQIANAWGRPAVFLVFSGLVVAMAVVFWLVGRDAPATPNAPRASLSASMEMFRTERLVGLFSLFYFVTFGGFVAFALYLSKLLVDLYGITPLDAGNRVFVFVLLATVARPVGGWAADRLGGARVLQAVFLVATAMALVLTISTALVPLTVACLTISWFLGLGSGAVFKLVAEHFPGRTGSATGIVGAAGGLGGFFPPLVMGGVRQALGSYWPGFLLLGLMALLCLVLNQRLLIHGSTAAHSEQARA
jgi:NNP family nitrate/nitrite transporter-like MFS transporter